MSEKKSLLVTSEMMQAGEVPLLFIGGASNIQTITGPMRNPGRDPLATWLDGQGWSYFDPQIHHTTHGRDYVWGIDGPQEKIAREVRNDVLLSDILSKDVPIDWYEAVAVVHRHGHVHHVEPDPEHGRTLDGHGCRHRQDHGGGAQQGEGEASRQELFSGNSSESSRPASG